MKTRVPVLSVILLFLVRKCILQDESFKCGQRPLEKKVNFNDNGKSTKGQWPWYGIVYHRVNKQSIEYACGGTLVSRKHVFTAKYCVTDAFQTLINSSNILVQLGVHKMNELSFGFAKYRRVKSIIEEKEEEGEKEYIKLKENVLLELSADVQFNDYVQPICININAWYMYREWWSIGFKFTANVGQINSFNMPKGVYSHSFADDPASISIYHNKKVWYFYKIWHYEWFAKVTNLEYLQKKRKGRDFNVSQDYPQLLPKRHCGKGLKNGETSSTNVSIYEFPWIALLLSKDVLEKSEYFAPYCIGTLISFRYVISTTGCTTILNPEFVRLGENNINTNPDCNPEDPNDCAPPVRDYAVDYLVYNQNEHIVLIRTKENIAYEDHIQPICLPVTSQLNGWMPSQYTTTAWYSYYFELTGSLQKQIIDAANTTECQINGDTLQSISLSCRNNTLKTGYKMLFGSPVSFNEPSIEERFVLLAVFYTSENQLFKTFNVIPELDWIRANMLK